MKRRHASSGDYTPSSKTADTHRLLDPSYSSPRPILSSRRASFTQAKPTAYVDHDGDLHDPDYRHFPPMPSRRHSSRRRPKPRWTASSGYLEDNFGSDDDESQSEDESEYRWHGSSVGHGSPSSRRRHGNPHRRIHRSSSPAQYDSDHYYSYPTNNSPSSSLSSPLSSSPEDDASLPKRSYSLARRLSKAIPRSSSDMGRSTTPSALPEESPSDIIEYDTVDVESQHLAPTISIREKAEDDVPTCTDPLKREWRMFALGTRIKIFRLKKKIRALRK